jgi:hypothetical protein
MKVVNKLLKIVLYLLIVIVYAGLIWVLRTVFLLFLYLLYIIDIPFTQFGVINTDKVPPVWAISTYVAAIILVVSATWVGKKLSDWDVLGLRTPGQDRSKS